MCESLVRNLEIYSQTAPHSEPGITCCQPPARPPAGGHFTPAAPAAHRGRRSGWSLIGVGSRLRAAGGALCSPYLAPRTLSWRLLQVGGVEVTASHLGPKICTEVPPPLLSPPQALLPLAFAQPAAAARCLRRCRVQIAARL